MPKGVPERWKVDRDTGCWIWARYIDPSGYGKTGVAGGKTLWAHRLVYEEKVGPIPEGAHLHHTCKHRACVNPDHMELLSARAHAQKDRHLSMSMARQIRQRLAEGEKHEALAEEFGVVRTTIKDIEVYRTWREPTIRCPHCGMEFDDPAGM
jgi:hypothetical protein